MSTTIAYGVTTLTLTQPLLWTDEFAWEPVRQTRVTTITGAQIVYEQTRQAGRPVTLVSGGWIRRDELEQLQAWRELPAAVLQVAPRGGAAMDCVFDHEAGALQAEMVQPWAFPDAGELYRVTLRFFEV
jgi:hypothetical protein